MNPRPYHIANPATPADATRHFRGEYFEMYGPAITTQYSEVFWQAQKMALPKDIVKRFDGKVMAVTGYEVDIVRKGKWPWDKDTSVPCFEQYNHHYTGYMSSTKVAPIPCVPPLCTPAIGPHGKPLPSWARQTPRDAAPPVPLATPSVCDFSGLWRDPTSGLEIEVKTPGTPAPAAPSVPFTAACLGTKGWRQGHGVVQAPSDAIPWAAQGSATLLAQDDPTLNLTGLFDTSERADAPRCSKIRWSDDGVWYRAAYLPSSAPYVQVFSEGNGNEHRGSYHGFPTGYAQLLRSPGSFTNSPMVININKHLTGETSPGHVATLQPRRSLAPVNGSYNGVLECPCTSRQVKIVDRYLWETEACPAVVLGATAVPSDANTLAECAAAAKTMCPGIPRDWGANVTTVHSQTLPRGCSATTEGCVVTFNTAAESPAPCTAAQRCICRDATSLGGSIAGAPFDRGVCAAEPVGDLLAKSNGICNISAYEGGLQCCSGGSFLLDAEQEVPKPTDTFHLKYRFYFEPEPSNQTNLYRTWWSTEARNNEYDIPQSTADCQDPRTDPALCVYQITSHFKGRDMLDFGRGCMVSGTDPNTAAACMDPKRVEKRDEGYFKLLYAAGHCHAPACQSLELWDDDRKALICRNDATIGDGGGEVMNEQGFVVGIPPCLWGDTNKTEGLLAPPLIHLDSNLSCVKRSNNTNGHWGVMSLWQMRAAYLSTDNM